MTVPLELWSFVKLLGATERAARLETRCIRSNNFMFSNLA